MIEAIDRALWMTGNDDYDGLPPDGFWEEQAEAERQRDQLIGHHCVVDHLAHELAEAASGDATAISFAIATVQRYALAKEEVRLSLGDRDRLLTLLMQARTAILSLVRARHGNHHLPFAASAIDAVAALIVMWSEAQAWDDRPKELRRDVQCRARWLRNEMHNISVEAQYRQQKSDRALQIVSDLQVQALERRYG